MSAAAAWVTDDILIVDCVSPEMPVNRGEIEGQPFLSMLVSKRPLSCSQHAFSEETKHESGRTLDADYVRGQVN
jgi:hypothetical protein